MTTAALIALLSTHPPDMPVLVSPQGADTAEAPLPRLSHGWVEGRWLWTQADEASDGRTAVLL